MTRTHLQAWIFLCSLPLASPAALAQCDIADPASETARGTVFVDGNGDGARNAREQGVQGVSVSNGCEVVLTDADGDYEIALAPLQILFVSQPAGYSIAVDANNIPRFYYRHYPEGTPDTIGGTAVALSLIHI